MRSPPDWTAPLRARLCLYPRSKLTGSKLTGSKLTGSQLTA